MQQTNSTNSTDNRQIAALISRLLSHYWTAADPPETRQAQIEDWLEDLREFGPELVSIAIGEWRRRPGGKRPTPGDIRALVIEAQRARRDDERVAAFPQLEDREERTRRRRYREVEMQREGRAFANEWAQRRGYADLDAYAAAEGIHIIEAYGRVIAENLAGSPLAHPMSAAAALGVTAREYAPTDAAMMAGRRALGLEPAEELAT